MSSEGPSRATWRGAELTDLFGASSPWQVEEFPPIVPAYNHAVLYHVKHDGPPRSDRPPTPQRGQDKWEKDYVRMPYSTQSLYPVEKEDGETELKHRWQLIEAALSNPIRNSNDLAEAIISYNTKFKNLWTFAALHKLFNECLEEEESDYFFSNTLPEIIKLALALPQLIPAPIPLLQQQKNRSVSLSQQQIASLLANAFFCTFPRRNTEKRTSEYASYPFINFNSLYEHSHSPSVLEKLKCICHYFRRVTTKVPTGVMTFVRRTLEMTKCPRWPVSHTLLGAIPVHIDAGGTIEDEGKGLIQIDFANKYLGGGVLNHGCVQEEIRFVICPELLVSMLFTEVMKPNEALLMIGCERYSNYTGYSSSFLWAGDHQDDTPRDSSGRIRCAVLAIDAMPLSSERIQYRQKYILREINKAWVGVSVFTDESNTSLNYPGIATGNWGCGAFGGSPKLKFLIQLIACAQAKRPMAYFTFGDTALRDSLMDIYMFLAAKNITVGNLFVYLLDFWKTELPGKQLYAYIIQAHNDHINKPKSTSPSGPTSEQTTDVPSTSGQTPSGALTKEDEQNQKQSDTPKPEETSETTVKPLQISVKPPQSTVKPPQTTDNPPASTVKPPQTTVKPQQRDCSPDIFASDSEPTVSQSKEKFLDLEKGEGNLHVYIHSVEEKLTLNQCTKESNSNKKKSTSSLLHHMTLLEEEESLQVSATTTKRLLEKLNRDKCETADEIKCETNVSKRCETKIEGETCEMSENDSEKRNDEQLRDEKGPANKMAKKITDYFSKNKKF